MYAKENTLNCYNSSKNHEVHCATAPDYSGGSSVMFVFNCSESNYVFTSVNVQMTGIIPGLHSGVT